MWSVAAMRTATRAVCGVLATATAVQLLPRRRMAFAAGNDSMVFCQK